MSDADKEIYHEWTDLITCPYCGYQVIDSWEYDGEGDGESGEILCVRCAENYRYDVSMIINYTTWID